MAGGICERVTVQVSLVIAAVDDFSGRPEEASCASGWKESRGRRQKKTGTMFLQMCVHPVPGFIWKGRYSRSRKLCWMKQGWRSMKEKS